MAIIKILLLKKHVGSNLLNIIPKFILGNILGAIYYTGNRKYTLKCVRRNSLIEIVHHLARFNIFSFDWTQFTFALNNLTCDVTAVIITIFGRCYPISRTDSSDVV